MRRPPALLVFLSILFTVDAGLSFLHTHAEGMGFVLLLAAILVASLVRPPGLLAGLQGLLGYSALL